MLEGISAPGCMAPSGSGSIPQWQCITGCGACCRLDPALRQEALEALSPEQRQTYLALVGDDGWCRHFDTGSRRCRIYSERPDFCQVSNLVNLFAPEGLGSAAGEAFAIDCCTQQIRSEYGGRGKVMKRFLRANGRRR
jgi:Fe-S-cluster containining protein